MLEAEAQIIWRAYKLAVIDLYFQIIRGLQPSNSAYEPLVLELLRGYRAGLREPEELAEQAIDTLTAAARERPPFLV